MTSSLESLVLDGLSLNDGTTFDLVSFEFNPAAKRQRWISGEDADGDVLAETSRAGNRSAIVTLRVAPQADMDTALSKIGQIVDKLYEAEQQPDGLALAWTPADSTKSATAYVLSGEITDLPVSIDAGWFAKSPTITLRLDCLPYMEGTEVTSAATVTNSLPYQVLTIASVTGDVPAKARIAVTDAATQSRRHVELGLQWRYYDAATDLYVDSDNLVTSGFSGTGTTRSGAHDPGASGNSVVRGTLISSPTAICGLGNLGHVGAFRVKARVYAAPTVDSTADDFKVRLSWKEGDGPLRSNTYVSPPITGNWCEVDLGVVNIPPKTLGTQRWTGQIEAYSEDAGDTLDVDYLLLFPTLEGYGKARGSYGYTTGVLVGRDEFTSTTAGNNLNARAAPSGGTWATSGSATDFQFADVPSSGETIVRSTTSDAGPRYAILGSTNYTDVEMQANVYGNLWQTSAGNWIEGGIITRWTDSSNYLRAGFEYVSGGAQFRVAKVVAGVTTTLAVTVVGSLTNGVWYTPRLVVYASGIGYAFLTSPSGETQTLTFSDSTLATGGTLATGKPGLIDFNDQATASTRYFDDVKLSVPATEPIVVNSGRSAEFRHDQAGRYDSTGAYFGAMPSYMGAHFFLPPAGDENRTSRLLVKARRNDIDVAADDQIGDSTTVTVHYTPRWSVAPR